MQIEFELPEEQKNYLEQVFSGGRFSDVQDIFVRLAELAIASWMGWLFGEKRYTSLTEQYVDWIGEIYSKLLPDEAPSAGRLYNSFNVPYGQAQYIARVLSNRTLTHWRQQATDRLKSAMVQKESIVRRMLDQHRGDNTVEIIIDGLSFLELKNIYERLFCLEPTEIVLPRYSKVGNLYAVQVSAKCFDKIYDIIGR